MLYLAIFAGVIMSSFFWGWPGQEINMRRANKELAIVRKKLESDPRFSNLKIGVSTADLGKRILVHGTIPDNESLQVLKALMSRNISHRFRVIYQISLENTVPAVPANGGST